MLRTAKADFLCEMQLDRAIGAEDVADWQHMCFECVWCGVVWRVSSVCDVCGVVWCVSSVCGVVCIGCVCDVVLRNVHVGSHICGVSD